MSNRIYTTIYQLKGINSFSEIEKWCKKEFNSPVKHSKRHQEEFRFSINSCVNGCEI